MKKKPVLIIATPKVTLQDVTGPWEVFCRAEIYCPGTYDVKMLATEKARTVRTKFDLDITCSQTIFDYPGKPDTILVAGSEEGVQGRISPRFDNWLRCQLPRTRRMGSICTGAFYLAHAGLLDGHRATTHWRYLEQLGSRFPNITVEADPIFVEDGKLFTSAGITAGIDLSLALVEADCGHEVALTIARDLVVFIQRQADQPQLSRSLALRMAEHDPIRDLQRWAPDNLHRLSSVEDMAARVNMSPRNFARSFKQQTGFTPGHYLRELRNEAARRHSQQTQAPQHKIASATGFGSTRSLRRSLFAADLTASAKRHR